VRVFGRRAAKCGRATFKRREGTHGNQHWNVGTEIYHDVRVPWNHPLLKQIYSAIYTSHVRLHSVQYLTSVSFGVISSTGRSIEGLHRRWFTSAVALRYDANVTNIPSSAQTRANSSACLPPHQSQISTTQRIQLRGLVD